ncbi:MAG: putative metal-binding motif-containing protein [Alphaproteobacteria bacterium]|nr:putative metal-binding motif-containing protein [Alphaproteobacteria bacterium]
MSCLLLLLALLACGDKPADSGLDSAVDERPDPSLQDADGDGVVASLDCDDGDARTYPGAEELCDAADQDCDGVVDEGVTRTAWPDADGDGYGDPSQPQEICRTSEGQVLDDRDCDDSNPDAHPAGSETCDGADRPARGGCDGVVDEDAPEATLWFADLDGDGYGDPETSALACEAPASYVADNQDCDDSAAAVFPGAEEICEDGAVNDCDGARADAWDLCGLSGEAVVSDAVATLIGPGDDLFGHALAAGDVNGDGHQDLFVGAYWIIGRSYFGGGAYLFHGPLTGALTPSDAAAYIHHASYEAYLGYAVDVPGDLDGDGVDDLVLSSFHSRLDLNGNGDGDVSGSVYVFHGPVTGTLLQSDFNLELRAGESHNHLGGAIAHGDLNDDGQTDLFATALRYGEEADQTDVAVWLGPHAGGASREADLVFQNEGGVSGAWDVAAADLDGDGVDDLITGTYAGTVNVYAGPVTDTGVRSAQTADVQLSATRSGAGLGEPLAVAGDMDGDGYQELALVEANNSDAGPAYGAVYLLPGPLSSGAVDTLAAATLYGQQARELSGAAVAGAGDHDQDGYDDLLVRGVGLHVVPGPVSGAVDLEDAASWVLRGESGVGNVRQDVIPFEMDGDPWLEIAAGGTYDTSDGIVFILDTSGF